MAEVRRYRFEDLRGFGAALAAALGVAPARASALAGQLLWFDAAGVSGLGIGSLPDLLKSLEGKEIDPKSEGRVVSERAATAVLDAGRGVPLLALEHAAGIAGEKARDVGVGVVRVKNLAPVESAAGIAAEIAIGPHAAFLLGPGSGTRWSVALPCAEGLPAVFDPTLRAAESARKPKKNDVATEGPPTALARLFGPWASVLAEPHEWLIVALSIAAIEGLSAFHERVSEAVRVMEHNDVATPGRLVPSVWEARRRELRERGVSVSAVRWNALVAWGEKLAVEPPNAC